MSRKSGPIRILVVEDEPLIRRAAVDDLTDSGFEVSEAADADEALQLAHRMGQFEVLFTDVRLPSKMDGLELAAKMNREGRCRMVIYASGYPHDPPRMVSPSLALRKPYMVESVVGAIRALEDLLQAESDGESDQPEGSSGIGPVPATYGPVL